MRIKMTMFVRCMGWALMVGFCLLCWYLLVDMVL